jgi:tetratricopeptide (TPR) repeat protein
MNNFFIKISDFKKSHFFIVFFIFVILSGITSCSSAPKNPGDIFILRTQAEEGLEVANREAAKGNLEIALSLLTGFKRNAILADDSSLIVRVCLSRGNVLFSLGRIDEAFVEWDQAVSEAQRLKNSELISVSRIFRARGRLLSGRESAQSVLDEVTRESANIRNNRLYIAFSFQVRALAFLSLDMYREAEDAARRSLEIHERDRHLENASFDWYTIASVRSLSGNTEGALQALETSIALDRRIENSAGLGASYRAMGDVYRRAGREQDAQEAFRRAREIFNAMNNDFEVSIIDERLRN